MKKKYDIVAFGEALIDFISAGEGLYKANAGGAPFNLAVCAARGGCKCAFLGKVGKDCFGELLVSIAKANGVDIEGFAVDEKLPTTHAFVTVNTEGENGFAFCRAGCADVAIIADEVNADIIKNASHFHFGGLSLTDEPCKSALYRALETAKKAGLSISFDPNYRPFLWSDRDCFVKACLSIPVKPNLLKVSENEALLLSGAGDLSSAMSFLLDYAELVLITLGEKGVMYGTKKQIGNIDGCPAKTVDTTGAGDIFLGSFLAGVFHRGKPLNKLEVEDIARLADKSCRIAAASTEKEGAIPSIPEISF